MSPSSSSSLPPYSPPAEPLTRAQSKAAAKGLPFSNPFQHANTSSYTLRSIPMDDSDNQSPSTVDLNTPLRSATSPNYGATSPFLPRSPGVPSSRRPLLNAAIKMAALFVISCLVLGGTLWLALPRLEELVPTLFRLCISRLNCLIERTARYFAFPNLSNSSKRLTLSLRNTEIFILTAL